MQYLPKVCGSKHAPHRPCTICTPAPHLHQHVPNNPRSQSHPSPTLHAEILGLAGVVVVDVVEGTALASLPFMDTVLAGRPARFGSLEEAVEWAMATGAPGKELMGCPAWYGGLKVRQPGGGSAVGNGHRCAGLVSEG